jgi:hypothetical protein
MGAAALPIAALALTAGSTMLGATQKASGLRAEARQDAENGRLSLKSGEQEAMDTLREARFEQGGAAAEMAGSGLAFGGSISTVLADSANAAEMDIERIRERAAGEANNYYANAKQKRKAARGAIVAGIFSSVSSAVSAVAGNPGAFGASSSGSTALGAGTASYSAPGYNAYAGSRG